MSDESRPEGGDLDFGFSVVSWTGGKDGCLAAYRAILQGVKVSHLLSFWNVKRQGAHEVDPGLLSAQAEAMEIPLIRRGFESYEEEFKRVVRYLNGRGERGEWIDSAIFGHIQTHNRLVERICQDLEIELLMPIWRMDSEEIIEEVVAAGFEVVLVAVRADLLGEEWLGRKIDEKFVADLRALDSSIDPCGENGEFHTLVLDCPLFKKRLKIARSEATLREDLWFLDVLEFGVEEKE
ncbi:diphthine--ammonia ligase, partial [Methanocrinis sp.]|uniref:Dph6-related ATP pyrophosphatase n=1 Tax=Methanocrinis sp. TaxID=3101522 RepID=UPI003D10FBAA